MGEGKREKEGEICLIEVGEGNIFIARHTTRGSRSPALRIGRHLQIQYIVQKIHVREGRTRNTLEILPTIHHTKTGS